LLATRIGTGWPSWPGKVQCGQIVSTGSASHSARRMWNALLAKPHKSIAPKKLDWLGHPNGVASPR
jgi:hypothetical protein